MSEENMETELPENEVVDAPIPADVPEPEPDVE